MHIASGGEDALEEIWLMTVEKWQAAAELSAIITDCPTANPVTTTRRSIALYRNKIAANRSRLGSPRYSNPQKFKRKDTSK